LQQEIDDAGSPEFTGPCESVLHLLLSCRLPQTAILVKETADDVKPSDTGCSFQIQARASIRKELGGRPASIMQAGVNGAPRTVDDCAMTDQEFH
jgi:hypothetical protein